MSHSVRKLLIYYVVGFLLSLLTTIVAFLVAKGHEGPATSVVLGALALLAVTQLIVQLVCFFHLGREPKPYLNSVSFIFMAIVVATIGFGSLWIMHNLNYNMMPDEVEKYIEDEEGIKRETKSSSSHSGEHGTEQ